MPKPANIYHLARSILERRKDHVHIAPAEAWEISGDILAHHLAVRCCLDDFLYPRLGAWLQPTNFPKITAEHFIALQAHECQRGLVNLSNNAIECEHGDKTKLRIENLPQTVAFILQRLLRLFPG